jgi:excisionase family DNA binding protein
MNSAVIVCIRIFTPNIYRWGRYGRNRRAASSGSKFPRAGSLSRPRRSGCAQDAADILGVSRPYLLNLVKKGILPCRMVGAHHRIPVAAVISYRRDEAPRRRSLEALTAETQEFGH